MKEREKERMEGITKRKKERKKEHKERQKEKGWRE